MGPWIIDAVDVLLTHLQVVANAREHLTGMAASEIEMIKTKFIDLVELAQQKLISCFTLIVKDLESSARDLLERCSGSELLDVVSQELDNGEVTDEKMSSMFKQIVSLKVSQEYYVAYNKRRAVQGVSEKFFTEVKTCAGNAPADLCPLISSNVDQCFAQVKSVDMKQQCLAMANLTAITALARPLKPGETRNVLTNKVLKGMSSMSLVPSKGLWPALEKSATPQIFAQFKQCIQK